MQEFKISELTNHPRNAEFFDDITGGKWDELLDSIRQRISEGKRGNIEPIIITQDKTIVSGHQRVRAFRELGIPTIAAEVKIYSNDDEVLRDLLESNIRRRGEVGGSAKKVGLRIKELERLYGISHGNNQYGGHEINSHPQKSQSDLATELEMDVRTLQNYKLLADMIPELDDLVTTGIVTKTTALAIMRELSAEEQEEFISQLDITKKLTQREVQTHIEEIKKLKEAAKPEPVIQTVERIVDNTDYEAIEKLKKELALKVEKVTRLEEYKTEYETLLPNYESKVAELQELRNKMDEIKNTSPEYQYQKKMKDSTLIFCSRVATFIEQVGGFAWLAQHINELPELERNGYIKAINTVKAWADTMEYNINANMEENIYG